MSAPPASPEIHQTPFSFQPPPGGDVSLKSSDGTLFVVHSMFLSFGSKVFSDMLASSIKADIVELAEDAEAISLMLAFIYPMMRPSIDTISLLEKAMLIAHKYEIGVLAKTVKQATGLPNLIRKDPLRIYRMAGNYGFQDIEILSAKLITREHYDMTTVDGLVKFSKEYPECSRIIGIVGAHGARARLLEVLSPQKSQELWPLVKASGYNSSRSYFRDHMSCDLCWEKTQTLFNHKPGWLDVWFARLRSALNDKLILEECDSYFELSCVLMLRGQGNCCSECVDFTRSKVEQFETWAKRARSHLEKKLAELDVLYTL